MEMSKVNEIFKEARQKANEEYKEHDRDAHKHNMKVLLYSARVRKWFNELRIETDTAKIQELNNKYYRDVKRLKELVGEKP